MAQESERAGPTVNSLLAWASDALRSAGIERPLFEAQVLLAHVLQTDRGRLLAGLHREPSPLDAERFRRLIQQRQARMPLAYLRGVQEFYGLEMRVTPATLIPRPETELLVERVLSVLQQRHSPVLVDVCTGSGCIAVACAVHVPDLRVLATDISEDALAVAAVNCRLHGVADRVDLAVGDVLDAVRSSVADVVTANPAYIPSDQIGSLQAEVRVYEPRVALDGGPDGLVLHRRIVEDALHVLRRGGMLAVEVAYGQARQVMELMQVAGFTDIEAWSDLAGIERAITARCP